MREREREIAPRVFLCAHVYTNEESALLDLPTLRHPFKSLFKTRPKRVSLFTAKEKKKKKNLTLSSFPDLSSFFIEDTFSIALLLLLLLQRERERKREERERQSTKIRERVQRQPRSRRFEEKLLWDFFFKAEKQRDLIPRNDIIIFSP